MEGLPLHLVGVVALVLGVVVVAIVYGPRKHVSSERSGEAAAAPPPAAPPPSAAAPPPEPVDARPIVRFYWGSQTGTSAGFAKKLVKAAVKHGLRAEAVDTQCFGGTVTLTPPAGGPGTAADAATAAAARERLCEPGAIAVFILATYGEGDPTDNASGLVSWLTLPPGSSPIAPHAASFSGLRYSVFGLGNRQYEHFNKTGISVDAALARGGGKRVHVLGIGDDDGTMEEDFEKWHEGGLWDALRAAAAVSTTSTTGLNGVGKNTTTTSHTASAPVVSSPSAASSLDWRLTLVGTQDGGEESLPPPERLTALAAAGLDPNSRHFFHSIPVRVVHNRELRQAPRVGSSTRHIEVTAALEGSGDEKRVASPLLGYSTADNLYLCPDNDDATVSSLCSRLRLDAKSIFSLEPRSKGGAPLSPLFPTPCSVRCALTRYLDLHAAPTRELLAELAPYATDATERAMLLRLSSKAGRAEFGAHITARHTSVAELFNDFPSLTPPLEPLVQLLPRLQPRAYTIASSSLASPHTIAICASVVDVIKPEGGGAVSASPISSPSSSSSSSPSLLPPRRHRGVASSHIARAAVGHTLRVSIRPSSFRLPRDHKTPLIMVGPGTGIAPFRAFVAERTHVLAGHVGEEGGSSPLGEAVLFFGCRSRDEDYIYAEELAVAARTGVLTALHVAFSRERGGQKVYVQHLMEEHGSALWTLLQQPPSPPGSGDSSSSGGGGSGSVGGAHVFVCGGTRMGVDVSAAFERIAAKHGGLSSEKATAFVRGLQVAGRYTQELWTI